MSKVLFEHIESCVKLTKDREWQDIIHNCACNKFPKGIKYNNSKKVLYVCSVPNKKAEVITLPEEQLQCFKVLMFIFKNLLGLRSGDDISTTRAEIENTRKGNEINYACEWKTLKPKTIRNHILINFAVEQTGIHKLDRKQAHALYRQIQLGFQFKQLTADDVKYKNGIIMSIQGLKFDTVCGRFEITNKPGHVSYASASKVNKDPLKQRIGVWIKNHKKQALSLHIKK